MFEKNFLEHLNKNFDHYSKYFVFEYQVFYEFRPVVYQISKCLILELDYAVITLTNHLLERLLKLALISKAVGIKPIPKENWNTVFAGPQIQYGSLNLGNSIELCKKENLIDATEKDFLFEIVRELMRNGFSHADPGKVLSSLPDEISMFEGSFSELSTPLKEIKLNPKIIPPLQWIGMEQFAKTNASSYFDFVFKLIEKIETRLAEMEKLRTT